MYLFRKDEERLKVWVSLLNLENLCGSGEERLEHVLRRAIDDEMNEESLFRHLANIYVQSNENEVTDLMKARGNKTKLLLRHRQITFWRAREI